MFVGKRIQGVNHFLQKFLFDLLNQLLDRTKMTIHERLDGRDDRIQIGADSAPATTALTHFRCVVWLKQTLNLDDRAIGWHLVPRR